MFMAWVRAISGRLKSDLRLAVGLVYHSFPFPEADAKNHREVEQAAQAVLDARTARPEPLADLYGPSLGRNLARAHDNLDRAVTAAYGKRRPRTDADRLTVLFERYAILTGGTLEAP
jgi:restriction-modification enzyme MmeI-like protein